MGAKRRALVSLVARLAAFTDVPGTVSGDVPVTPALSLARYSKELTFTLSTTTP